MLFGEYLVKNGILTQEQVDEILRIQSKTSVESGKRSLLGDIAVECGHISKEAIEKAFLAFFREE
ncbi:MAG: hypothetical protein JXB88_21765 [Spirochaetales bacterium]|nr:hypothetical protein [Spirochaetales bacterium]